MSLAERLISNIKGENIRIVFPEATDPRVLGAVVRLKREELLEPVLVGKPDEIYKAAEDQGFNLTDIEIFDPENYDKFDEMVASFVDRRKGKATEEQAREVLKGGNYFGTMLVYMDIADGLISGVIH